MPALVMDQPLVCRRVCGGRSSSNAARLKPDWTCIRAICATHWRDAVSEIYTHLAYMSNFVILHVRQDSLHGCSV